MPAVSEEQRRFMGSELDRKRAGERTKTGMSEQQLKDFASSGGRRNGRPRTDAERKARHKSRYGTKELPLRGTGLKNLAKKVEKSTKGSKSYTYAELKRGYRRG